LEVTFFSDAVIEEDRLLKQYQRGKRYEIIFRFEFEEQIDLKLFRLFS
jgi:hypothetical protein